MPYQELDIPTEIDKVLNNDTGLYADMPREERVQRAQMLALQGIAQELAKLNKRLDAITSATRLNVTTPN